jgi:transcriptional regulator with XRE-family HTH domain
MIECPLDAFLTKYGKSVVAFCEEAGCAQRTVYDLLNGARKDYSLSTLQKIEAATGGEVTLRSLAEWIAEPREGEDNERRAYRPHRARA